MADNNLQASFKKLMRYAQNLAEYEQGIAEGIIDENVFVIVLEEKVAKFKGHTFEWNENVRALLAVPREELTDEEAQYNIDTRNRIILGDTKLVVVLEGLTGIHYYNDVDNNVYVSYRVVSDGYVLSYEFIINEDGGVELSQEIFALTICDMRNRDDVMLFFAGVNIFSEVKGIINGEDGTQYEVDAYNLESRFVEYNKGDKRYRVMFDAAYNITEEIDITLAPEVDLSAKQDKIDDLDTIRSGAALGATAIQQVKTINGEEIEGEGNIEIKADVDTSTLVTKEEFTDVEEVWAASYNLLNQKISDVQQYIYDEAASRRQFDEAIAEIQSIIAENESVVTAAWNQLNTRINALEAAQRG